MTSSYEEFQSLFRQLYRNSVRYENEVAAVIGKYRNSYGPNSDIYRAFESIAKGLGSQFNRGLSQFRKIVTKESFLVDVISEIDLNIKYGDNCLAMLSEIKSSSAEIVDFCNVKLGANSKTITKSSSKLLEEIIKIEEEDPLIYMYLEESIRSLEEDFLIGAVLVAGKVGTIMADRIPIDRSVLEKIREESTKDDQQIRIDEEKTKLLVNKKAIRSEDKDKYLTVLKKSRNYYSHRPEYYPKRNSEAVQYLSGVVELTLAVLDLNQDSQAS